MSKLFLSAALFLTGQTLIWFQTNGQFVWPWFKRNPIILSLFGGSIISYAFIIATRLAVEHFDGQLWPGRFLGFSLGMISYALLTWYFLGEGISTKTATSLILATGIICVQIFWK
tara:strand:- start:679 stop:1023 length:345 start_codon:yes stop_codon:yes gene_type:complete